MPKLNILGKPQFSTFQPNVRNLIVPFNSNSSKPGFVNPIMNPMNHMGNNQYVNPLMNPFVNPLGVGNPLGFGLKVNINSKTNQDYKTTTQE